MFVFICQARSKSQRPRNQRNDEVIIFTALIVASLVISLSFFLVGRPPKRPAAVEAQREASGSLFSPSSGRLSFVCDTS